MQFLPILAAAALVVSLIRSPRRTLSALKRGGKKLLKLLPAFFAMLFIISAFLYFTPRQVLAEYLGNENVFISFLAAGGFGSVTLMPGFVAFPLAGILRDQGVPFVVLAAFTTTLMMVGIATFPLERYYFGTKVALIRNAFGLIIALIVSFGIGLFFGELW
ncbi:MAG: permease [Spirochaetales bacterium]|nr:permease [Spirochaetales bacterium]MCF7939899.1 permease [Spirochaetales bacterium]